MQRSQLFEDTAHNFVTPFKTQLLKWVGNKQRFAHEIAALFPPKYNTYFEPFLGSGAVMGTLQPDKGIGSDTFAPLFEIWEALKESPNTLKDWYSDRWYFAKRYGNREGYEIIKDAYNKKQNGADLLYLCRACYGGVVRFRKNDGFMSTPCGVHDPITPESFGDRVDIWHNRLRHVHFIKVDYKEIFSMAKKGDLIYCDPPYIHSQSILYGGQSFVFSDLITEIERAKSKGIYVALSIDGTKKSGKVNCDVPIPEDIFERKIYVNLGGSMLRRFQMKGMTLEKDVVVDRLLLTY